MSSKVMCPYCGRGWVTPGSMHRECRKSYNEDVQLRGELDYHPFFSALRESRVQKLEEKIAREASWQRFLVKYPDMRNKGE